MRALTLLPLSVMIALATPVASATPAQGDFDAPSLCEDWKRVLDRSGDGFQKLRGAQTANDGPHKRWEATHRVYSADSCSITERWDYNTRGPTFVFACRLPDDGRLHSVWLSKYAWDHCEDSTLKGWWFERLGPASGEAGVLEQVRVSRPDDPSGLVSTWTFDKGDYVRFEVTDSSQVDAHRRTGARAPAVAHQTPRGLRKDALTRALTGEKADGNCHLLLLGRRLTSPEVKAMLGAMGGIGDQAGDDFILLPSHGITLEVSGGVIVSVAYMLEPDVIAPPPPKITPFRGRLPYELTAKVAAWSRTMGPGSRPDPAGPERFMADRTWVNAFTTGADTARKTIAVQVRARQSATPYPLTAACGL